MCKARICVSTDTYSGFTCKDSDYSDYDESNGGIDIMTPGWLNIKEEESGDHASYMGDKCVDPKNVKEYYCEGNKPKYIIEECPEDYFCTTKTSYARCEPCDDTDKSNDPAKRGQVTDVNKTVGDDFCNDGGQLKQVMCNPENGEVMWDDPEDCPPGKACEAGECK